MSIIASLTTWWFEGLAGPRSDTAWYVFNLTISRASSNCSIKQFVSFALSAILSSYSGFEFFEVRSINC